MNDKQQLNESAEFWVALIGTKVLGITGLTLGGLLSAGGIRKIVKKFGGIKGFMGTLRDKKALRQAGFTDSDIRLLWSQNGRILSDLARNLAKTTIKSLRKGEITPNEALMAYRNYIPPGQAAAKLKEYQALYKTKVPTKLTKPAKPVSTTTSTATSTTVKPDAKVFGDKGGTLTQAEYNALSLNQKMRYQLYPTTPLTTLKKY